MVARVGHAQGEPPTETGKEPMLLSKLRTVSHPE